MTFINQDLNAICKPETLAGDCEAYSRWTQTSGRRRKQKLQRPPSARQASLLSLRKDQWQFEPLEIGLFLIFSLKKYCCETVSPWVNVQPEPVRLRVLVVKESLATKNVKIYNKTWKAIIVGTSQWNQGYLSSCSQEFSQRRIFSLVCCLVRRTFKQIIFVASCWKKLKPK